MEAAVDSVTLDELPDLTETCAVEAPVVSPLSGPEWLLTTVASGETGLGTSLSALWSVWLHRAPDSLLQ
jgi:hypothetical protein